MKTVLIALAAAALFAGPVLADEPPASDNGAAPKTEAKPAEVKKPKPHHEASWHNGHGSAWRESANHYGFSGRHGGCTYHGSAGSWGYHIEKSC